jgi:hypothetical protein
MSTAYTYTLTTGVIVPDAAEIQTEVQTEYSNAFGTDLNTTSPSTPQGLLINAETQARIAVATNNANLANQINPAFAGGVFLDALLALMGSQRLAATYSLVSCTVSGVAGTIIPQGSLAQDTNGNQWASLNAVTIPLSGTITNISFQAVDPGEIVVTSGEVTVIISNVLGWNSITNPAANVTTGQNTQSDVSARQYRINTLYLQSNGLAGSIIAALYATSGVSSASFIENPSSSPATIKGVAMNANSIYVCVNGGTDLAIAATLTATKSAGCAYTHGASQTPVTEPYTVPISGQVIDVLFDRPDLINIGVEITVVITIPIQDYVTTVTDAILNYAAGGVDSLAGLVVGQNVSPFEISAAVAIQYPGIYVADCTIANLTPVIQTGTLTSGMNTVSGLTNATTLLYVGMKVSGTGIPSGTTIASIVDDADITLSLNATTSGAESLTFSGVGVYEAASIDIDPWQLATISGSNITVSIAS